jgi:hypothetical protein
MASADDRKPPVNQLIGLSRYASLLQVGLLKIYITGVFVGHQLIL